MCSYINIWLVVGSTLVGGADESELHFSESWFHRILSQGRSNAEELLKRNAQLGDGTFLVRPSETFVGGFSLSFLRKGGVRSNIHFFQHPYGTF